MGFGFLLFYQELERTGCENRRNMTTIEASKQTSKQVKTYVCERNGKPLTHLTSLPVLMLRNPTPSRPAWHAATIWHRVFL